MPTGKTASKLGWPPAGGCKPGRARIFATLDDAAFGAATPVVLKFISPAETAARWTGANGGLAFFAYATNYLIVPVR